MMRPFKSRPSIFRASLGAALTILTVAQIRAETSRPRLEVSVAYLPVIGVAPLLIMDAEGWAKDEGVDLKLTKFSSGPAISQALASGGFDGVYMAVSPVLVADAAGVDLKAVAATLFEPQTLIATGELAKEFSKGSDPATAFAAFAKSAGRPAKISSLPKGSMPDTALRYFIEHRGVSKADVQIVSQGEEAVLQSILAGATDGATMPEPIITIIKQKLPSAVVVATGGALMEDHPGFILAMRDPFIAKHPEVVEILAKLNARADAFIKNEPQKAAADVLKYFGKGLIEQATLAEALISPYNPPITSMAAFVQGTRILQDYQVKIGIQAKPVDIDTLFYKSALDQKTIR